MYISLYPFCALHELIYVDVISDENSLILIAHYVLPLFLAVFEGQLYAIRGPTELHGYILAHSNWPLILLSPESRSWRRNLFQ